MAHRGIPCLEHLGGPQAGTSGCWWRGTALHWVSGMFQKGSNRQRAILFHQCCQKHLAKDEQALTIHLFLLRGCKSGKSPHQVFCSAPHRRWCVRLRKPSKDRPCSAIWAPTNQSHSAFNGRLAKLTAVRSLQALWGQFSGLCSLGPALQTQPSEFTTGQLWERPHWPWQVFLMK